MPVSAPKDDQKRRREPRETPSIQSLDRGLIILEEAGKSAEPVSLVHLAAMLGVDRSSAFRLANTLKRRGYLANSSTGKDYILGPSVWRLSHRYNWSKVLVSVAHEPLKALATETNETAHLAVLQGTKALFIDHLTSNHVIAITGQTSELVPVYCTSHGKALLADFDERDLLNLLGSKPLKAYTKNTILNCRSLAQECQVIKAQGFSLDEAEYVEGVSCVAAPIRDQDDTVVASIGISAPAARFPKDRQKEYARQVMAAAAQIGKLISTLET
jgi:DNA-binding IclR family transcriptional regulator